MKTIYPGYTEIEDGRWCANRVVQPLSLSVNKLSSLLRKVSGGEKEVEQLKEGIRILRWTGVAEIVVPAFHSPDSPVDDTGLPLSRNTARMVECCPVSRRNSSHAARGIERRLGFPTGNS